MKARRAARTPDPPRGKKALVRNRRRHYLIQIERPGQTLTIAGVRRILTGTGVEIDESYGPLVVNPDLGRHAVRGRADARARRRAERIRGIRFFGDPRIVPLGSRR